MRAFDFFAGCGGASLGLERAGVEVLLAFERDPDACASHRLHAPGHVVEGDIAELRHLAKVDLWSASPPCQPFSAAGLRLGAADDRDGYPHLLRLLAGAGVGGNLPRWLLIENVPGLTFHKRSAGCGALILRPDACPACYLEQIEAQLRVFFPVVEARILDAADVGVPQHRRRLITVCGPRRIDWPVPTHGPGRPRPWVSIRQALGLGGAVTPEPGQGSRAQSDRELDPDDPATTLNCGATGDSYNAPLVRVMGGGGNPHGPDAEHERVERDLTDDPATTIAASRVGNGGLWIESGHRTTAPDGSRPPHRVSVDRPAPTVRSQEGAGPLLVEGSNKGRKQGGVVRGPLTRSVDEPSLTVDQVPGHVRFWPPATPEQQARSVRDRRNWVAFCHGHAPFWHMFGPSDPYRPMIRIGKRKRAPWWHRASPADGATRAVGTKGNASLLLDEPSPTVSATEEKGAGARTTRRARGEHVESGAGPDRASDVLLIGTGRRRLTVEECAILQDLPTGPYVGTKASQYRQVGNAAPPALIAAVVRAILDADDT